MGIGGLHERPFQQVRPVLESFALGDCQAQGVERVETVGQRPKSRTRPRVQLRGQVALLGENPVDAGRAAVVHRLAERGADPAGKIAHRLAVVGVRVERGRATRVEQAVASGRSEHDHLHRS